MKLLKIKYSYSYKSMNRGIPYNIKDISLLYSFDDGNFPEKLDEFKKELKNKSHNGIYEIIDIERI